MGFAALVTCALASREARAQPAPPVRDLKYDLRLDLPITITGGALWWGSELIFKDALAPSSCRWCDRNADGTDNLNGLDKGVRDSLKWSNTGAADTTSNILGFAVLPATMIGLDAIVANHDDALHGFGVDALVIAESMVIAGSLNQVVKFIAARERPFVHALSPDEKPNTPHPNDNNVSFFSAHTSVGMAIAVSAGTVASMRGYRWAPIVWAVGPTLAMFTGYLRIAADKHYFTDVMTGAVIGSAIGFAVPYVFHNTTNGSANGQASALTVGALGTRGLQMTFLW
jgi:membrane-associated phospholipid phosphatase